MASAPSPLERHGPESVIPDKPLIRATATLFCVRFNAPSVIVSGGAGRNRNLSKPTVRRTSERLLKSAASDPAAFAAIVREHQGMVYSIAYHFLGDSALAEDLAQDVFFHLYRNLPTIKSPEHLRFWLRKVASHRCIDHTRRISARPQISLEDVAEPQAPDLTKDPFVERMLKRLVGALPEKARMIVILRYQEDLEPAEIAEVIGMPLNTVKSHLRRSLAILREKVARLEARSWS